VLLRLLIMPGLLNVGISYHFIGDVSMDKIPRMDKIHEMLGELRKGYHFRDIGVDSQEFRLMEVLDGIADKLGEIGGKVDRLGTITQPPL